MHGSILFFDSKMTPQKKRMTEGVLFFDFSFCGSYKHFDLGGVFLTIYSIYFSLTREIKEDELIGGEGAAMSLIRCPSGSHFWTTIVNFCCFTEYMVL